MSAIHRLGFECNHSEKNPKRQAATCRHGFGSKKKKTLTFKLRALLDVSCPKLHKLSVKFSVILKLWVREHKWVVGR
jgi:hypothetical protein